MEQVSITAQMLELKHIHGDAGRILSEQYVRRQGTGRVYPTVFKQGEEIHFPLRGSEHYIIVIDGKLDVQERNLSQQIQLAPKEAVQLSRSGKKEYFDVKTIALAPTEALWVVIHSH
jgi:hypothetical protein